MSCLIKSLSFIIIVCCLCFTFFITSIQSVRRVDKNGQRRLKQQRQQHSSTTSVPSDYPFLKNNNVRSSWNSFDYSSSPSSHHIESFAEDDEYFDELKPARHTCEDIRIDICQDVGYNVTSMPNFVGHELQSDAEPQLRSFIPLISYGCSSQLKFFLCSVYLPMCTEKVPVMIGPCRPLCDSVKSRCAPVLLELGFQWPSALNCSKFLPENTIDHMCMEGPPPHESELMPVAPTIIKHNSLPPTNIRRPSSHLIVPGSRHGPSTTNFQTLPIHHQHYQDILSPSYNRGHKPSLLSDPSLQKTNMINQQRQQILSSSQTPQSSIASYQCLEYRRSENYVFLEHPRGRCVSRCRADVLFTVDNKNFVDYWTVVWSSLSLASCVFTLITFILAPQKFRYPERAIFYIALCYSIYTLAYIYRALVGRTAMSCYQEGPNKHLWLLVQEGAHNPHCTISFLMLYYFGMSGAAWWLVLATSWSLSVTFGWSVQRLSYYSQLYHSLAWTLPALQTLAALVMRAVDADELTGTCYVGSQNDANLLKYVILPMTFYLGTGIMFIITSFLLVRFGLEKTEANSSCCDTTEESISSSSNVDAETDHNSSLHSDSTSTVGCGGFCRRLRRNYTCQSNGRHRGLHVGSNSGDGSGHSLLLPNNLSNAHHQPINFCSATVSSTSSYSFSSASTSNNNTNKHCLGNNNYSIGNQFNVNGSQWYNSTANNVRCKNNNNNENNSTSLRYGRSRGYGHRSTIYPSHQSTVNNDHKDAALVRSGIFALFYTLPALCVLSTYIYEYLYREQWLLRHKVIGHLQTMSTIMPTSEIHDPNSMITVEPIEANSPNFEVFNMRLFMSLVIGIKTGIWILTAKSPISTLRCVFSRCMTKKVFPLTHSGGPQMIPTREGGHMTTPNVVFNAHGARAMISSTVTNQMLGLHNQTKSVQFTTKNVENNNQNNVNEHFIFTNDIVSKPQQMTTNTGCNETTFQCGLNGSTMSTTISSNISISNPSAPQQVNNFVNNNLILENPMVFGGVIDEKQQQQLYRQNGSHYHINQHRSGNETAV